MSEEPGLGEVARNITGLRDDVRQLASKLEAGYVRKDVQDAREAATTIQLKGIEDEQHSTNKRIDKIEERLTAHFRLLLAGLIYPLIVGAFVYLILAGVHH